MANATITTVQLVYKRVIDETIKNSRETFLNEGIEESVLQELRTLWESKVSATRAVEPAMNPPDYIPRGQIYKYNYRNQPPTTQQAGTSFSGHIPAFISQVVQQQTTQQQPNHLVLARQQIQHQQNVAQQQQQSQQHSVTQQQQQHTINQQQQHSVAQQQQQHSVTQQQQQHSVAQQQHSAVTKHNPQLLPRVVPMTSSRPSTSQTQGNLPFPSAIPFPSLSGVTTVTKNDFNNASDSIQVDGACDVTRDLTRDLSRDMERELLEHDLELGLSPDLSDAGLPSDRHARTCFESSAEDSHENTSDPDSKVPQNTEISPQITDTKVSQCTEIGPQNTEISHQETDSVSLQSDTKLPQHDRIVPSLIHDSTDNVRKSQVPSGKQKVLSGKHKVSSTKYKSSSTKGKVSSQKPRSSSRYCSVVLQLDGAGDSDEDVGEFVDSEDSEEDDNDDTDEEIDVGGDGRATFDDPDKPSSPVEDDEPLNSEDDDSDDGNIEFEATDNVVVCLFDKITRSKNKWKLYLKEGVMNIGGKDHVFHKAIGDGEW